MTIRVEFGSRRKSGWQEIEGFNHKCCFHNAWTDIQVNNMLSIPKCVAARLNCGYLQNDPKEKYQKTSETSPVRNPKMLEQLEQLHCSEPSAAMLGHL